MQSDRRQDERFDVVGAMWGVLDLHEPATIANVSTSGALLNSPVALTPNFTQALHLVVDGQDVRLDAAVRHVHTVHDDRGHERYMIGVEFVAPPLPVIHAIEQLAAESQDEQNAS
jgi:hypothetical protein